MSLIGHFPLCVLAFTIQGEKEGFFLFYTFYIYIHV